MKNLLAAAVLILSSLSLIGQSEVDALRYSQTYFGGTARSMGTAGAFGALGADLTAISVNPAGAGMYRSSELVFTPSLYFANTETSYIEQSNNDDKSNFNFNNAGLVLTNLMRKKSGERWVSTTWAFGMNRLQNFNSRYFMRGTNDANSITDHFAQRAQGIAPDDLYSNEADPYSSTLAYGTYLINDVAGSSTYVPVVTDGGVEQEEIKENKGAMDEYYIALGANYNNKLYMGGSIAFPFINFKSNTFYKERDKDNAHASFDNMELAEFLDVTGLGVNAKFGLMYRAHKHVRVGGAMHTPTLLTIDESFSSRVTSNVATPGSNEIELFEQTSPIGNFEYKLKTPWKLVGSAAYVHPSFGFVSLDVERVDYGQASFDFDSVNSDEVSYEVDLNNRINNTYKAATNVRLGAEYKKDIFRFRGGIAHYGNAFANDQDSARNSYTLGFGMREKKFYADVAYVHSKTKDFYQPYSLASQSVPSAEIERVNNNVVLTFGFRW